MFGRKTWRPLTLIAALTAAATILGGTSAIAAPVPDTGPSSGGNTVTIEDGMTRFTVIDANVDQTVALTSTGQAYAWGNQGQFGPLGDGRETGSVVPVAVTMPQGVAFKQISTGGTHSMALGSDGKAYAWGDNYWGQLGIGTTTDALVPVPMRVPTGIRFTQISAGVGFSMALGSNGVTYSWGNNVDGQLGNGGTAGKNTPTPVTMPARVSFTQLSTGDHHSLAIGSNGKTYAWGRNSEGQLGNDSYTNAVVPVEVAVPAGVTFTFVRAGSMHSLATGSDGNTYAWGLGENGQLGHPTLRESATPIPVTRPPGVTFSSLVGGDYFSMALGSDGNAYAWGANWSGELGDGTYQETFTPVRIKTPPGVTFTRLAAGEGHSTAVGSDGNTYGWGQSTAGELGTGWDTKAIIPTPVKPPPGVKFTQVDAGVSFSAGLGSDKKIYAWGEGQLGQLGNGATLDSPVPSLVQSPPGVTFTKISVGWTHALAIGSNGKTYSWGDNNSGQLGNNSTSDSAVPVEVILPPGVRFTAVASGWTHSLGVGSNGKTYAWGLNASGELGNGTTTNSSVPVEVKAPAGVTFTQVFANEFSTIALAANGVAYAWGGNFSGQLGTGSTRSSSVPVAVKAPSGVTFKKLATFDNHVLALASNGKAYAWGQNDYGQLGTGDTNARLSPVLVSLPNGVAYSDIAVGRSFSVAQGTDGETYAWGHNDSGQLGDGTTEDAAEPRLVLIPAGLVARQLGAGGGHTFAIASDGRTYAWGENFDGELGIGAPPFSNVPVLGANFRLDSVLFDLVPAAILSLEGSTITVSAPAGEAGKIPLVVTSVLYAQSSQTPVVSARHFDYTYQGPAVARTRRISGNDRYDTSLALNLKTMIPGTPVFVASGTQFADALSVGPAVRVNRGSLVLTKTARMDQKMIDLIKARGPSNIYIIGGEKSVSDTVKQQLEGITTNKGTVTRISGNSRYETSEKILNRFFSNRFISKVLVATGRNYPDALSAAAVGGAISAPILLVDGDNATGIPKNTHKTLKRAAVKDLYVIGGSASVSNQLYWNLSKVFRIHRLQGADRYGTNMAVNSLVKEVYPHTAVRGVWVAAGTGFPDALSAAVPAGLATQRLVLAKPTCVPRAALEGWMKNKVTRITLVGGTNVLQAGVQNLQECR